MIKQIELMKKQLKAKPHSKINGKKKQMQICNPLTNQQVISCFFKDIKNDIFQISDDEYSICFEYEDISFSKASRIDAEIIYKNWLDYLHGFTTNHHIQIVNASSPVLASAYKENYILRNQQDDKRIKQLSDEFNSLISTAIGTNELVLKTRRYITISTKANSFEEVEEIFLDIFMKTNENFENLHSKVRIVPARERLIFLYDFFNLETAEVKGLDDIAEYAKQNDITIYDVIAPKENINMRQSDYFVIGEKKYIRVLYLDPKLPKKITPKFYNTMTTTLSDVNMITAQNIHPTNAAKAIKRVSKKLSGMETERLTKVKALAKQNIQYSFVPDKRLEKGIANANKLLEDMQDNDQRLFKSNMLFCIIADSLAELNRNTEKVKEKAAEMLIHLVPMRWQQLEGVMHTLPFGHNTIQFKRTLTSEATAVHVPFNSKDFSHEHSLFYGINEVSHNAIFMDRKKLMNGNGCVLATSGAGKSFSTKMIIEQILLRYPEDDVIIIDYQKEYSNIMSVFEGQTIEISDTSDTHINPFDLDSNYDLKEVGKGSPIKSKTEYLIALLACLKEAPLTARDKTVIDRCARLTYDKYIRSNYTSEIPLFKDFRATLLQQPEREAKDLALILERFITGSLDMFAYETNVDIKHRLACFDISEMPSSMAMAGYLIIMDHIVNRLARNKILNKYTWIFFEEFHILLENIYAAQYVAKIYKVGRKLNAMNTIITQNIPDVLENPYGRKILSNSEFAVILKQKPLDKQQICEIFNITNAEGKYINEDAKAGHGIIVYGNDRIPFKNPVPRDYFLYDLNNTDGAAKTD